MMPVCGENCGFCVERIVVFFLPKIPCLEYESIWVTAFFTENLVKYVYCTVEVFHMVLIVRMCKTK